MLTDISHDIESFPNLFLAGFQPVTGPDHIGYIFELSERRNDTRALAAYLNAGGIRLVGFNNLSYDWLMLRYFLELIGDGHHLVTAATMYDMNTQIFDAQRYDRFGLMDWDPAIPQVDLFKIHHMERFGISLKQTQFNMRSASVMDSPLPFGVPVPTQRIDEVIGYLVHDVKQTKKFALKSKPDIDYRMSLGPDWVNYNDGKIGKEFFKAELKAAGVELYTRGTDGRRRARQTTYPTGIRLADVISPLIRFTRPDMTEQLNHIKAQTVMDTNGEFATKIKLGEFAMDLKQGGIHGSVKRRVFTTAGGTIQDVDVTSFYPSLSIEHEMYPAHIGPKFCKVYADLKRRRTDLPDKTVPIGKTLKLALTNVFGDMGSPYSVFHDPGCLLKITLNGQLMICMLAEQFANTAGVELIQANTDGVTIQFQPHAKVMVDAIVQWWMTYTRMNLESVFYSRMVIRDVNNYVAEDVKGKRKHKGAYNFSRNWQQNQSSVVIAKAATAAVMDGADVSTFVRTHADPWDFLILRKGRMELSDGTAVDKHLRYYVSTDGPALVATYGDGDDTKRIGVHAEGLAECLGTRRNYTCSVCRQPFLRKKDFDTHNKREHSWRITVANSFDGRMPTNVDYNFYERAAKKLVIAE